MEKQPEGNCLLFTDNSVIPEFQYQFRQPAQRLTYIGRTCVQHFTGNECDHGRDTKTGQAIGIAQLFSVSFTRWRF